MTSSGKNARSRTSKRSIMIICLSVLSLVLGILIFNSTKFFSSLDKSVGSKVYTSEAKGLRVESVSSKELPEVAWLMTYPNSGTTYTLQLIQRYTNTTTATNYGSEQGAHGTNIAVHPPMDKGPFPRHPEWQFPPRYILTKTHCGGSEMSPDPKDYIETVRSFEIACRSGHRVINGTKFPVTYGMDVPKRAVHLIRNPFDNIVARLHHEQKRWARSQEKADRLKIYNATREGFLAWCLDMDIKSSHKARESKYVDEELWNIAKYVPCHAEIIRYTLWHNYAIEVVRRHNLPVHFVFYEDYIADWDATVKKLFNFIGIYAADGATPPEFISGKHYEEYYYSIAAKSVKLLIQTLAAPETWNLLQRYFP